MIIGIYFSSLWSSFYNVPTRPIYLPHNNKNPDFLKEKKEKEEMP